MVEDRTDGTFYSFTKFSLAFLLGILIGTFSLRTRSQNTVTIQQKIQVHEPVNYQGDPPDCKRPELDLQGLEEYGCKIISRVCVDQNKVAMYDLSRDDAPEYPFYNFGWTPAFVHGYEDEAVNTAHPGGELRTPVFRRNSSLDRFDHVDPVFSHCKVPLVWVPPWIYSYGEFVDNSFVPMYYAQQELKLFDENILLTPIFGGYSIPEFVHNLMRPYSNLTVTSFADLGSREHIFDPTFPRCFETMILCTLHGLYFNRPPANYPVNDSAIYGDAKFTYDGDPEWTWWKAGPAGRHLVEYYKANGLLVVPEKDPNVIRVTVGARNGEVNYRNFIDLDKFLEDCNAWVPPKKKGVQRRMECVRYAFGKDFIEDLKTLQQTDVFMAHHGAELNNAWFMPEGSSAIEVRMFEFDGGWPDLYFRSMFRTENYILYWQAIVTKPETWKPSIFEIERLPHRYYHRDRHTVLRWSDFQAIIEGILKVNKNKRKYEKKTYDDIRYEI